jgi:hypothetical protein
VKIGCVKELEHHVNSSFWQCTFADHNRSPGFNPLFSEMSVTAGVKWALPATPSSPFSDTAATMGVFRRLLLERLHHAERLSDTFMRNLL